MNERKPRGDEAIMAIIAQGDDAALAELYDRYADLLFGLAARILRSDADAEEVTAEVFSTAWRRAAEFDPDRGSARAWLTTMTRTRSIDLLRARGRRRSAHERSAHADAAGVAVPLEIPEPSDRLLEHNRMRDTVLHALSALPEAQRTVVELAYFHGLTQSEIAAELDAPLGTIKTRARTALQKLRAGLSQGSEPGP